MNTSFDPTRLFLDLTEDGHARPLEVNEEFWSGLKTGEIKVDGSLVSAFHMEAGTGHWERHPRGDELLCLISGSVQVVLDVDGQDSHIPLNAERRCFVVPRGIWHRFTVDEPSLVLFVTPGEGTEHRPL